jgi:hypothetical protein
MVVVMRFGIVEGCLCGSGVDAVRMVVVGVEVEEANDEIRRSGRCRNQAAFFADKSR